MSETPKPEDDPARERSSWVPVDETELHEPEDPEGAPSIPAAGVAAHAGTSRRRTEAGTRADREIWSLSWPVILSQLLASAISLIDIAMLGRLGSDALAAVGYVTQFFWLAQAGLMAVGIAGVSLISQSLGSGRVARARAAFAASICMSMVFALVIAAAVGSAPLTLLGWLNAAPDIAVMALPYLQLTMLSTLLFAVSISFESGFRAVKNTRTPLWIALGVTAVKATLNWLLIFNPLTLGLVGAGLATLGAQSLAVVALIIASRRGRDRGTLRLSRRDWQASTALVRPLLSIAWPAIGERLMLNLAVMTYFVVLGSYGPATVATYTVGVRILSFSWIPATGFAAAAATLVGHAIGGKRPTEARVAGWRAARLAIAVSSVLGLVSCLAREPLARAFTNDPQVVAQLSAFVLLVALAQPFLGIHFTLAGALRGAGATLWPLLAATVGNFCVRVPMAWVVGIWWRWDPLWLWAALVLDHVVRTLFMVSVYRSALWIPPSLRAMRRSSSSIVF